jgi:hypothetical protein
MKDLIYPSLTHVIRHQFFNKRSTVPLSGFDWSSAAHNPRVKQGKTSSGVNYTVDTNLSYKHDKLCISTLTHKLRKKE